MQTKLYVGNLTYETTERDLEDLFNQAGSVQQATVITDRESGRSRGFGFVVMNDDAGAKAAIAKFDNQDYQGRNLVVNEARDREERPGGGGGGRPGGNNGGGGKGGRRERRF